MYFWSYAHIPHCYLLPLLPPAEPPLPPNKLLFYFHILLCACVCLWALRVWTRVGAIYLSRGNQEMRPSPLAGFLQRLLSPGCSAGWSSAADSAEPWEAPGPLSNSHRWVCLTPAIFISTPAVVPALLWLNKQAQLGSWNQLSSANSGSAGPCLPVLTPKMNILCLP